MSTTENSRLIRNKDVLKLLSEGKTHRDVAIVLGCSVSLVANVSTGRRTDPMDRSVYRNDVSEDIVLEMVEQGMYQSAIAKKLECSPALISTIVNKRRVRFKEKKTYVKPKRHDKRKCSNCDGEMEPGQTMLCLRCYTRNSEGRRYSSI